MAPILLMALMEGSVTKSLKTTPFSVGKIIFVKVGKMQRKKWEGVYKEKNIAGSTEFASRKKDK